MVIARMGPRPVRHVCHYRLHRGISMHLRIWLLIWENSVGVDQAAVWMFTPDRRHSWKSRRWSSATSSRPGRCSVNHVGPRVRDRHRDGRRTEPQWISPGSRQAKPRAQMLDARRSRLQHHVVGSMAQANRVAWEAASQKYVRGYGDLLAQAASGSSLAGTGP
jgi:hypothetical protein